MIIQNRLLKKGFSINLLEDARLEYPKDVWEDLDKEIKKIIIDNLVYLKVSPYGMFLNKEMNFCFSKPFLKDLGDTGVIADIPRVAEEDKISTRELIERFQNKKIIFKDENVSLIDKETSEAAILGISFGKDSLLSYGVAKEIGLKTKLVFVQDCWDIEMVHKLLLVRRFEKEFEERIEVMRDEIDDISSYKRINTTSSEGIVGSNAMNGYMLMFFPFAVRYRANKIIFGNEQNFNDFFVNKEGFRVYPSYEQSSEWMIEQNKALKEFTNDKIKVTSFIEPLYNIAEVKVLFSRYPSIAKYQMSCSLSKTRKRKEKWCYYCPMCAKAFLYLKANGIDPEIIDFNKDFFGKEYEKFYPLFNDRPERVLEKPKAVRDEQLLAFYLAFKNGCNGYLIDKFKEKFLEEAREREDELYKRFFSVYDAMSISGNTKEEINSIYKEELSK
jgi:hypothetical protein